MDYAIDRIRIGSEEEVSADAFYGINIPQRKTRFFCPECGESVLWRSRGGNQPDEFYHHPKTTSSPECAKRVDGKSDLYLYERVGLPMSLVRLGESNFRLNIIFPAIEEKLLDAAVRQNSEICISSAKKDMIFPINFTYFRTDATTLIPVEFVPQWGENYTIQVNASCEIKRKWSDYSDGFARSGAIFTYEETGGKKIRRGDSISPGRQYYIVSKEFNSPYREIKVKQVGTIRLNESKYSVYIASVSVSTDDECKYKAIDNYLKTQFDVLLLETAPEITALWPPVTEQDVQIPIKTTTAVYCAISSGNTVPKVYSYRENIVTMLTVNQDNNGINTLVLPIDSQEVVVSVDRKYVGREIVFQNKPLTIFDYAYEIALEQKDGLAIELETLTPAVLSSDLVLKSNAKLELYIGSCDNTYLHVPIRSFNTPIPERRNSAEIIFAVENGIIKSYCTQTIKDPLVIQKNILCQIKENCRGEYVPAPRWIGFLLLEWQRTGYYSLVSAVRRSIHKGLIPCGLLTTLQTFVKK